MPRTWERTLQFDSAQEQVIGDEEANRLLRASYRAPYIVPEKIDLDVSSLFHLASLHQIFLTSSHDFDRCRPVLLAHKPNDSELIHYRGIRPHCTTTHASHHLEKIKIPTILLSYLKLKTNN